MSDSQKTTIMAVVAVVAIALLGFMAYKFMTPASVDTAGTNAEVNKAVSAAKAAPPPETVDSTNPTNANLPPGKGRHR